MRYIENSGVKKSDLDSGYSDTGYIPEEGDDVGKLKAMAKQEKQEEKAEREMAEKYGYSMEEDIGGFCERRNTDDRM